MVKIYKFGQYFYRVKLPNFYIWFSVCSQKYRRTIKICASYLVCSQIWLHVLRDDCHFFHLFLWLIATLPTSSYGWSFLWLQTKIPQKQKKTLDPEICLYIVYIYHPILKWNNKGVVIDLHFQLPYPRVSFIII